MDGLYCPGFEDIRLQRKNFEKFEKKYNIKRQQKYRDIFQYIDPNGILREDLLPFSPYNEMWGKNLLDHIEGFLSDKYRIFTSQPYITIDMIKEELKKQNILTNFIKRSNIGVEIYDSSQGWYYPRYTPLIVFKMKRNKTEYYRTAFVHGLHEYMYLQSPITYRTNPI